MALNTSFEKEVCSRCGGSGNYSYCQDYGTRCFKCARAGEVLTKRGKAAQAYYVSLCEIPASEVQVGMRIKANGVTNAGKPFSYVATVTEIISREGLRTIVKTLGADGKTLDVTYKTKYSHSEGFSVLGSSGGSVEFSGEAGTFEERFTEYRFKTTSTYGEASQTATGKVRVYRDDDSARLNEAISYQATLTKTGLPRKKK